MAAKVRLLLQGKAKALLARTRRAWMAQSSLMCSRRGQREGHKGCRAEAAVCLNPAESGWQRP